MPLTVKTLLDSIADRLEAEPENEKRVQWLMDELTWELRAFRRRLTSEDWMRSVTVARSHRLRALVHEDPFTQWSFNKPRGYPGDASLLDFIYGEPESREAIEAASALGKSIFARNRNVPSCRAVRFRKKLLREKLASANGRVLSVACGHLREFRTLGQRPTGSEIVAFDQDERSLAEVRRSIGEGTVIAYQGSIRQIVAGRFEHEGFGMIYAAGLYDYLGTPLAQRLTQILFEKLAVNGTLLFANFTLDTEDVGYMEVYKDWWLTYRDESDMLAVIDLLPAHRIGGLRLFRDPDRHLVFCELTKI